METHYIWYLFIIYIRHRWYDKNGRKLTGECVCDGINEWRIWAIEWIVLLAYWWVEFGNENRKTRRMRKKLYLATGTRRNGGGQVEVTVWGGVKVKGIKTTLCCKICCEAWIYAQVSMEGEQETEWLSQWGSVLAEYVGDQAQEKESRAEKETLNTTRPTGSCQALHPSLPEHFPWDSARWTRGLLLSSAPPEDEGLSWIRTGSHSRREEHQAAPGSSGAYGERWKVRRNTSRMKWVWGSESSFKETWTDVHPEERKTRRGKRRWVEKMN